MGLRMKITKVALLMVLTSGLLITGCTAGSHQSSVARVGEPAPYFELKDLEGQSVSLDDFSGKPILLNFWATWCPPCRLEMPYLEQVYEEWSDQGLVVLAINEGESSAQVREFVQSYGLTFPVLLDTRGAVAQAYNPQEFLPTSFFIDRDGVVQVKIVGAFPGKAAIENNLSKIIP